MTEGWLNKDYLVLFSREEGDEYAAQYQLQKFLPGYYLMGLRNWDEFIVIAPGDGAIQSLPNAPIDTSKARPFTLPGAFLLEPDDRLTGKIRWYQKPLAFGGDAEAEGNLVWVSLEQHIPLVIWWNEQNAAGTLNAPE